MPRFIDNTKFSMIGVTYKFVLSIISVAIYIRMIGIPGFALVGIVKSVLNIMYNFNCPFFLSLLKQKDQKAYSTLLNSVFISNILIVVISVPVSFLLANYVYKNEYLVINFFIGALAFTIGRVVIFFIEFLRSIGKEYDVMVSSIAAKTFDFALTLILLMQGYGVLSIFIGMLCGSFLQAVMLLLSSNKMVKYSLYFSSETFKKYLTKYIGPNYLHSVFSTSSFWIGFLVSSFFLSAQDLGILSIFISITLSLRMFIAPLFYHLSPIFLQRLNKHIMRALFLVFQAIVFVFVFALVAFGEPFYILYFDSQLAGTYSLFLVFISIQIYGFVHIISGSYLFVKNIKVLIYLHFFLTIALGTLMWLFSKYGLIGAVAAYAVVFIAKTLYHYHIIFRVSLFSTRDALIFVITLLPMVFLGFEVQPLIGLISYFLVLFSLLLLFRKEFKNIIQIIMEI